MSEMTGLERCLTVLNGGVADRVPVVPQTFMFAAETAGIKVRELAHNTSKMLTTQGLGHGDANHRRRPVRDLVPCAPDRAPRINSGRYRAALTRGQGLDMIPNAMTSTHEIGG